MRRGKSYHLNSTCDIGEPDLPGPDRGKRGAMWREPLTGNMGEDLEPHKPVHETTTGSWTSKNGNEGGRPTSSLSLPASHGWCHLHFRERGSPMKNRKREICTSGSVRDEDGQPPHLLGRRQFLHLAAAVVALPAISRNAWAHAYPSRPVHIIFGLASGSAGDILARLIGQWLSERLGQPFVIENRVGAGGTLAAEAVVRSPPDGYTLLACGSPDEINATLNDKLNFVFLRDVAPIAGIARGPHVLVVHPSFPAKTIPEFIAYAKANPGKVNFGSAGIGTMAHMAPELFKVMAGIDMVHVPYRGLAPALTDLLGGQR